jgi:hypothetical protein
MNTHVIQPLYNHYQNLPNEDTLFNVLLDTSSTTKEIDELTEFYKMCNEYYSPEFGIKYLLGVNLYPFQMATVRAILGHKFPLILFTRGGGKTFMLAVYAVYHAIMHPGSRIVLVSASFRQSKLIFSEIQRIYDRSPLLRQISEDKPRISTDNCHYELVSSSIKALPLGTGDKIRGERGHVILADEFNSIPIEIFDIVVRGFAATESDPWMKTRERQLRKMREDAGELVEDNDMAELMLSEGNKVILSGTAGFKGGTFYKVYKQYATIIANGLKGRAGDYAELLTEVGLEEDMEVDARDYCISKYTYFELPAGMQDVKVIENARATMPLPLFNMEYMADFADDSLGFFKPRDVEAATCKPGKGHTVKVRGEGNRSYVMGVDPAKTHDRFAIIIIECGTPNKVIYCWTMDEIEKQTYTKGAQKIRELMRIFNITAIAMDEGGGGLAVEELLNTSGIMGPREAKLYRHDDDKPEANTGLKILHTFAFNPIWLDDANSLLQKNIEDKVLMFPRAQADDSLSGTTFQAHDDVAFEILEMKKELVSIEVTYTKTGKKQFNLAPPDPRKDIDGVVRHKDRYSALLLANYVTSRFDKLTYDNQTVARDIYNQSVKYMGWQEDVENMAPDFG